MKRVGQALEVRMLIDSLFDADENAMIAVCGDFNDDYMEESVEGILGAIENTNNPNLIKRVLIACENTVPEPSRYSLIHQGRGVMLDHLLASRSLLAHYRGTEIHNELLHDESVAFATDRKFPESDHAPVVAAFELPD
jgi:predicted extracellular nuclease